MTVDVGGKAGTDLEVKIATISSRGPFSLMATVSNRRALNRDVGGSTARCALTRTQPFPARRSLAAARTTLWLPVLPRKCLFPPLLLLFFLFR